jgi:hypothetical protein
VWEAKVYPDGHIPLMPKVQGVLTWLGYLGGKSMAQKGKDGGSRENKIGRDAKTGQFIPVKEAEKRPKTTVVETIKKGKKEL